VVLSEETRRRLRALLEMLALFVVYVATARLGLTFDALAGVATTVWPPTGVAIAAICLGGRGRWPAVFLAAFAVNAATGIPHWTSALIAVGNTGEALLAREILVRLRWRREMERVHDVFALSAAALAATTVSATLGTIAVRLAHIPVSDGYGLFWMVWWVGDVLGALLIAPVIFVWSRRWRPARELGRWLEGALLALLLVVVGLAVFHDLFPQKVVRLARGSYSIWPLLIWAVVRFRQRGGALALLLVSLIAISGTATGHGLFAGTSAVHAPTPHERLFRVQCFMAVTAVSMMFIAAALAERRQAILARDEFISIASHELKTPLTALRLRLATALKVLGGERIPADPAATEKATRAVIAASATTDRLGRLIEDLLDVSRLTARRLELSPEEMPVRDLIGEVAARLREPAAEAGSPVVIEIDDAAGPLVATWDRGRIEQVVTNLLSNAIKYGAGREITITARAENNRIEIAVRDGGIGIGKADQERIFQAFERVESVHRVGGLGLGLYIGRQIAAAHGGTLRVVSEPGRGSTFVLDLPRAAAPRVLGAERDA
jgi:signal transduction histidine kinase